MEESKDNSISPIYKVQGKESSAGIPQYRDNEGEFNAEMCEMLHRFETEEINKDDYISLEEFMK